jgi:hypothetical protein
MLKTLLYLSYSLFIAPHLIYMFMYGSGIEAAIFLGIAFALPVVLFVDRKFVGVMITAPVEKEKRALPKINK